MLGRCMAISGGVAGMVDAQRRGGRRTPLKGPAPLSLFTGLVLFVPQRWLAVFGLVGLVLDYQL
jgi:hypothetical protein